jgi:hypothetical protein
LDDCEPFQRRKYLIILQDEYTYLRIQKINQKLVGKLQDHEHWQIIAVQKTTGILDDRYCAADEKDLNVKSQQVKEKGK